MRMLLTAAGLRNDTLVTALSDLLDRPFDQCRVSIIVTASLAEDFDKAWLIDDLVRVRDLGWAGVDIIDLNTMPPENAERRLRQSDVIYVEGGNQFHLARSLVDTGLDAVLRDLLDTTVYVGVSAGSMIFSRHFTERTAAIVGDTGSLTDLGLDEMSPPFGLFDWYVKPHLNSPGFPERDDAWADAIAERTDVPIYLLDDHTAIRVRDADHDVVSDGDRWRLVGPNFAVG